MAFPSENKKVSFFSTTIYYDYEVVSPFKHEETTYFQDYDY